MCETANCYQPFILCTRWPRQKHTNCWGGDRDSWNALRTLNFGLLGGWILPQGPESVREQDGRRHCWKQMAHEGRSLKGPLESFGNDLVILGPDPLDILACIHIEY